MNVIYSKQKHALYIVFPTEAAHIGSTIADLSELIKGLTASHLYKPLCKAFIAVKQIAAGTEPPRVEGSTDYAGKYSTAKRPSTVD